jgi:hypothetical protein
MPKVTLLALSILDHRVDVAHGEIFFDEFVMTIQALLPFELALLCLGRRRKVQENDAETEEHHPDERRPTFRICSHHIVADRTIAEL